MMDKLFNGIYKGKRVLITGHTGFKGSWLSLWLAKLGAEVIGYSISIPTKPSHFELLKLKTASIRGDILDKKKIWRILKKYRPDIVFHLAAQALVRESYTNPVLTFETNVMGTVNVLEGCRRAGVRAIINVTSDKCYQNTGQKREYVEEDPMGGDDPYSASKGAAELVANSYRNSFFNASEHDKNHSTLLADVRAGNVIGGGDWAKDRLVPDIVRAASRGEAAIIRSPQAVRPWQHVLGPLSGYLQLGQKLLEGKREFADNWNFGPGGDLPSTVLEIVEQAKIYWDAIHHTLQMETDFREADFLTLDSSRARAKLHWKNVWDSRKTFLKTIQWYKNFYEDGEVNSEKDLDEYICDARSASIEWVIK